VEDVLNQSQRSVPGGISSSALALGLASAAIEFLSEQAQSRLSLKETAQAFAEQLQHTKELLFGMANAQIETDLIELRLRANSIVMRATQAALVAAKGRRYVSGHCAERWCREALFFLVWSSPEALIQAQLDGFTRID